MLVLEEILEKIESAGSFVTPRITRGHLGRPGSTHRIHFLLQCLLPGALPVPLILGKSLPFSVRENKLLTFNFIMLRFEIFKYLCIEVI